MRQHNPDEQSLLDVMFATSIGEAIGQIEKPPANHAVDDLAEPFPSAGASS